MRQFLMPIKTKIKSEFSSVRKEFETRVAGYIVTALGLVAGLAWNEFIRSLIDQYIPAEKGGLWAKLSYAIVITALVVLVSVYLMRAIRKEKKEEEKSAEKSKK